MELRQSFLSDRKGFRLVIYIHGTQNNHNTSNKTVYIFCVIHCSILSVSFITAMLEKCIVFIMISMVQCKTTEILQFWFVPSFKIYILTVENVSCTRHEKDPGCRGSWSHEKENIPDNRVHGSHANPTLTPLTHLPLNKIPAISQTTISSAF